MQLALYTLYTLYSRVDLRNLPRILTSHSVISARSCGHYALLIILYASSIILRRLSLAIITTLVIELSCGAPHFFPLCRDQWLARPVQLQWRPPVTASKNRPAGIATPLNLWVDNAAPISRIFEIMPAPPINWLSINRGLRFFCFLLFCFLFCEIFYLRAFFLLSFVSCASLSACVSFPCVYFFSSFSLSSPSSKHLPTTPLSPTLS